MPAHVRAVANTWGLLKAPQRTRPRLPVTLLRATLQCEVSTGLSVARRVVSLQPAVHVSATRKYTRVGTWMFDNVVSLRLKPRGEATLTGPRCARAPAHPHTYRLPRARDRGSGCQVHRGHAARSRVMVNDNVDAVSIDNDDTITDSWPRVFPPLAVDSSHRL